MSVDGDELLFWLILDEFKKNFSGIADMVAVASMLASFPVIPVRGKLDAQKNHTWNQPAFSRKLNAYSPAFSEKTSYYYMEKNAAR
nr:hypothetical protein [Pantoea agglomerans]